MINEGLAGLFDPIQILRNDTAKRRYEELVALDQVKERLTKEAELLIDPGLLEDWSKHHYNEMIAATSVLADRAPFFIFAGDVGTGKTQLAETFGDAVARDLDIELLLMPLSLRSRGSGSVGEMTQLITSAFAYVEEEIKPLRQGQRPKRGAVLLIDEADALVQSRELAQMHHEDRAGVNAMIRGIDSIADERRPVITVMCSNRLGAIDPAIRRRAADTFTFARPDQAQRAAVLARDLAGAGFDEEQITELARLTGESETHDHPFTFSDLRKRFIPNAVLEAVPDKPLDFERLCELARQTLPTPPFSAEGDIPAERIASD